MEITNENEKIEFDLLLQAIYQKYGYDFRNYAKGLLKASHPLQTISVKFQNNPFLRKLESEG